KRNAPTVAALALHFAYLCPERLWTGGPPWPSVSRLRLTTHDLGRTSHVTRIPASNAPWSSVPLLGAASRPVSSRSPLRGPGDPARPGGYRLLLAWVRGPVRFRRRAGQHHHRQPQRGRLHPRQRWGRPDPRRHVYRRQHRPNLGVRPG